MAEQDCGINEPKTVLNPKNRTIINRIRDHLKARGFLSFLRSAFVHVKQLPKQVLKICFRFQRWHVNIYSNRPYAQAIVRYLNDREARGSVIEIGCGLGDILRRLNYEKRAGLDREQEVLNAASFISKFHIGGGEKIVFRPFDLLKDELEGQYDVIIMVNWIHNIPPEVLKKKMETFFRDHLNPGGELVFDVITDKTYQYNHDYHALTSGFNCRIEFLGSFSTGGGESIVTAVRKK
jgi:SAM-dependent methyltransferase